jgi:hypothetical protein
MAKLIIKLETDLYSDTKEETWSCIDDILLIKVFKIFADLIYLFSSKGGKVL